MALSSEGEIWRIGPEDGRSTMLADDERTTRQVEASSMAVSADDERNRQRAEVSSMAVSESDQ